MNRLKLILQDDGSAFFGWQTQREERTVQGELEAALTRLTGARRPVEGSGRTDRGVHATGQVAAVSLPEAWEPPKLEKALNAVLPNDIWVESVESAASDFSPRYDAIARTYLYRLGVSERSRSPFHRAWCWALATAVDDTLLSEAADLLPGKAFVQGLRQVGPTRAGRILYGARSRVGTLGGSRVCVPGDGRPLPTPHGSATLYVPWWTSRAEGAP